MSTRRTRAKRLDTEGLKIAQEVAHETEEALGVAHLDPIVGDETPETERPAGVTEEASVWVFAYGSNMNKSVLSGRRMITPAESIAAILPSYKLSFNQPGLPYREPGFATVEKINGSDELEAHGVAHLMTPTEWEYYKETEGAAGDSDEGYGVIEVTLKAYDGREIKAYTLETQPKTIKRLRGRKALPSLRYLNLLRTGAEEHNLDADYQKYLQDLQHYEPHGFGGQIGAFITACLAFGLLFPVFIVMRFYRKMRGLNKINTKGFLSRFQAMWFNFVFGLTWSAHEILRPILGDGVAAKPSSS